MSRLLNIYFSKFEDSEVASVFLTLQKGISCALPAVRAVCVSDKAET